MQTLIPAHLIIGSQDQLEQHVEDMLKNLLCQQQGVSCFCPDCQKIANRQHHHVIWITPEKDYTTEDVAIIFDKIRFTLDDDQPFFFVLEHAQTLNDAAANRLLKILEEPPAGYHFILMATNEDAMLPTIRSRCHITRLTTDDHAASTSSVLAFFYTPKKLDEPFEFEEELRRHKLSDSQSMHLMQMLLQHYLQKVIDYHKALPHENINSGMKIYTENVVEFLKDKLLKPPQSGSSTMFWKNLFLQFPRRP